MSMISMSSVYDVSVLLPARNEQFLRRTIEDLLKNIEGNTEIVVALDGEWADPALEANERVTVIYLPVSIGQRAACNLCARLAKGKYLMKLDAHCAVDQGFDVKMLDAFRKLGDNVTMVPTMYNLHAFDWVCPDGHRRYQSPSGPCSECGKDTEKDVLWQRRKSRKSTSYCFDSEPHFQYFKEFTDRPEGKGDYTETMSLQGSCFMLTKEKWFELDVCEESLGSWGSQGIEVACKTWLSGGRVIVNQKTWYSHMFRTQGGDFGFPYKQSENQIQAAKKKVRDTFYNNKWPQQLNPLSWLVEKFWPVPGWSDDDLKLITPLPQ